MVMGVFRNWLDAWLPSRWGRGGVGVKLWANERPPPSIPPLKGKGRLTVGSERPPSIPQGLGVVAVAVDDELVLDAPHAGNGGGAEAGGDGLGEDVAGGEQGVAAGRGPQDIGIVAP